MLSEERINLNYCLWIKRLEKYGCYSERMINEIGEKIKTCSFSLNENSGSAYNGSMIDVVLNRLCTLAVEMNTLFTAKHKELSVDTNSLIKVLLLQHIAKSEMFVPETQKWKINNGNLFGFNTELPTTLKCGERSCFICMKYGISLTEEEYEAIKCIDKEEDKLTMFQSPLFLLVKTVNQLVATEMRNKWLVDNKPKIEEMEK